MWGESPPANSGRERAIETLIDMEPHGAFYRAARVLEEAVPHALSNRPNLVTRAALVEQANSLSKHEIDTLDKYNRVFPPETSTGQKSPPAPVADTALDDEYKDRVLRHHAKLVMVHRVHASGGPATVAAAPPPQLVAALRRVYGSSSEQQPEQSTEEEEEKEAVEARGALLRSLLRTVMNHKAFSRKPDSSVAISAAETNTQEEKQDTEESHDADAEKGESDEKDESIGDDDDDDHDVGDARLPAANLESIIGNVCRVAVSEGNAMGGTNSDVLHGLLIAALSILTASMREDEQEHDSEPELRKGELKKKKMGGSNSSSVDSLTPIMPALQVGGVLSLLQMDDSATGDDKSTFNLDTDTLSYLGKAAAAYEERIEIHKSRLLARMQADRDREAASKAAEEASEKSQEKEEKKSMTVSMDATAYGEGEEVASASEIPIVPMTPTEGGADTPRSVGANVTIVNNEEETDGGAVAIDLTADGGSIEALSEQVFDRIASQASQVSGDETSSAEDADDTALRFAISGEVREEQENSDSDSTNSEEDDGSASTTGYDEAPGQDENALSALIDSASFRRAADEVVELHDEDDSSSSSSSSSEDEDEEDVDPEAMLVEDDSEESDDDHEDAMLRQALALSLAEHSSAVAAAEGSSSQNEPHRTEEEGGAERNRTTQETNENENDVEEEKLPSSSPRDLSGAAGASIVEGACAESVEVKANSEVEDDLSLPSLPVAPSQYPYQSWLSDDADVDADVSVSDAVRVGSDESSVSYLDPAALSKFGSLPCAHVVVHFLRLAIMTVQRRENRRQSNAIDGDTESPVEGCLDNSVPGGVGCSLFVRRPVSYELKGGDEAKSASDDAVSVQLLVAAFELLCESRMQAVDNLRQAIALEQNAKDDDAEENEEEGCSTPTSDEEDDPALQLAMISSSSASPSMTASSVAESLEAKGMTRKAAAAAHDAAVLLKSLRKRTEAWKQRVQLYSECTLMVMRCLRIYLQSMARQSLHQQSLTDGNPSSQSLVNGDEFLPSTARSKLSETLASLMSVNEYRSFSTLIARDDDDDVEELLLPLKLYREAVLSWGECVPLLFPTPAARAEILRSLINDCYLDSGESPAPESLENLLALPSSDYQTHMHRMQILCQRLCVSDMLDGFVALPVSYDPDADIETHEIASDGGTIMQETYGASSIMRLLDPISGRLKHDEGLELRQLYLALCHRYNVRVLLWNGFYASSSDESDGRLPSASASPSRSSRDILRVASNPSTSLQFDSSKCSDSIAILSNHSDSSSRANGASAHQRASKVWGTVMSSSYFSPKTGIHRWAVRLDKCERGHVFVGVATAQASMRTYVGGDKFGWGVIGTQALWHDRRKIRGDYGATFRTGSTIIITLDTDAGTLSFSTWKDSNTNSSAAFSLDAMLPTFSSPARRQSLGGGKTEDWGVAFEGLPLDSRLYPAVGLYQRDDRVTLLNVESGARSSVRGVDDGLMVSAGVCYYPRQLKSVGSGHDGVSLHRRIAHVRRFNDLLSWDGVKYVSDVLNRVVESLQSPNEPDEVLLASVLPSIATALCLVPHTIPVLSARCALALLPQLTRCIRVLDGLVSTHQNDCQLFREGLRDGKWIIRATGSSGTVGSGECEEYIVNLATTASAGESPVGFQGTGIGTTGKSKNGLVVIMGTFFGSAMSFVEEWTDGSEEGSLTSATDESSSSCVIAARLSLDGRKFEGTYRNVQYGTTGHIAGSFCSGNESESALPTQPLEGSDTLRDALVKCEALLCLAHGHLAGILGSDSAGDHAHELETSPPAPYEASEWTEKCASLKSLLPRLLLSWGLQDLDGIKLEQAVGSLKLLYSSPLHAGVLGTAGTEYRVLDSHEVDTIFSSIPVVPVASPSFRDPTDVVERIDEDLVLQTGGKGSLCSVCPSEYNSARRRIICALVYHSHLRDRLLLHCEQKKATREFDEDALSVWRAALRIMEDGMRKAISLPNRGNRTRRELGMKHCTLSDKTSSFLLQVQTCPSELSVSDLADEFQLFYSVINHETDLRHLEGEMERSTKRALLRTMSLHQINSLLSNDEDSGQERIKTGIAVESCALSLPRLLGRGLTDVPATNGRTSVGGSSGIEDFCDDDLGGYYLTKLAGSGQTIRHSLRQSVHGLFQTLGRVLGEVVQQRTQTPLSNSMFSTDSLVLSILAVFTATIRSNDVAAMITGSGIIGRLQEVLSTHREAIRTNHCTAETMGELDQVSVVREIRKVVGRDISRAVLRSAVSVAHVISFQLARQTSVPSRMDRGFDHDEAGALRLCTKLLLDELSQTIPLVETALREESVGYGKKHADEQWEKWCEICIPTDDARSSSKRNRLQNKVGISGVIYLIEKGTLPLSSALQATSQKSSSRAAISASSGGSDSARSDDLLTLLGTPCQQYLSQWLNILSGMVKFSSSLSLLSEGKEWTNVLLNAVGLHCRLDSSGEHLADVALRRGEEGGMLPIRYRVRILRLLLCLLSISKPSEKLVEGLFSLAGSTSSAVSENVDDENSVSREAVSLLRHLHSPSCSAWRACIHRVIVSGLGSQVEEGVAPVAQLGILAFFSGSVDRICRGSFVLLKPAAAAPLSSDAQSSSSSKAHGSSGAGGSASAAGGTPHHVVGNGTEGIIAGLCRGDASAGIVSSVDVKSGICEVVLTTRRMFPCSDNRSQAPLRPRSMETGERGPSSARYSMTVRALRAPLVDVVNAEEVPLFLDEVLPVGGVLGLSLPTALRSLSGALLGATLASKLGVEKDKVTDGSPRNDTSDGGRKGTEHQEVLQLCTALMALRAATTALSDERLLAKFIEQLSSRQALGQMLELACCDQVEESSLPKVVDAARVESLSSLPNHEARYSHRLSMLRELSFRMEVMKSTPESQWKERLSEHVSAGSEAVPTEGKSSSSGSAGVAEGYSTPPSSGTIAETPPALATATAGDEGDAISNARSNRAVSQSSVSSHSTDEEEDTDATAAAHLREAAIAQMAELGLPRSWSELALRRTGGTNIEAAVHFCLERGGDMERLLAEERERERMLQRQSSGTASSRRRGNRGDSGNTNHLLRQLLEMGFPSRWCAEALTATSNNVDEALTWILTNGERLSAEDEGMEDDDEGDDVDDDEDEESGEEEEEEENVDVGPTAGEGATDELDEEIHDAGESELQDAPDTCAPSNVDESKRDAVTPQIDTGRKDVTTSGWSGSVTPLRFISGRSIINPQTLAVSGLPTGGFSSVGTRGIMLTTGKWYYEAILETAGCLQIGWADGSFSGHCHADRGDGCGDGPSSWAYDGWRRYRWHATATEWGCRWKEGDVVGCLVDMDEHVVSFTLNGRGEEIGMGVAFSGTGFRPCSGVYACVSFNRREKLRLILGGKGSEPFKHQPPSGYVGVGEAVLDAVEEHGVLMKKEDTLDAISSQRHQAPDSKTGEKTEARRFLCDFSDGEHGHELFAWQHRYYGSDASVHLGSGRSMKQSSGNQKQSGSTGSYVDSSAASCVSRRIEKVWSNASSGPKKVGHADANDPSFLLSKVQQGYEEVASQISEELRNECIALGILYARKFILHLIISLGSHFDLQCFIPSEDKDEGETQPAEDRELVAARRLWRALDVCVSLRSAGWVGEAGAMAVAAEALGLGISSNDSYYQLRHNSSDRGSIASAVETDDAISLAVGGVSQLLSTTLTTTLSDEVTKDARDTASSLAACAEAAIGGEGGGGPLVFLQRGLQSAACKSEPLRRILIAVVRRSVRLLAVVDYDGNDSLMSESLEDEDMDGPSGSFDGSSRGKDSPPAEDSEEDGNLQPDARLACFLTGLLLSRPIQDALTDPSPVMTALFEAWSVGLLSASAPWRMVCAYTASGILNACPEALPNVVGSLPTLARFYARFESTVVRRVWAERAAVPVCSRYVQSMIELLASVKRAAHIAAPVSPFFESLQSLSVDAATPIPLQVPLRALTTKTAPESVLTPLSWEWEEGWISCDAGWELWSGTIECMAVDWKTPSRSAVRALMDGGEGPPMLREGCTVMRGLDWDDDGSGSKTGNDDGKDLYETAKAEREKKKRIMEEEASQNDPAADSATADATQEASPDEENTSGDPLDEGGAQRPASSKPASPATSQKETDAAGSKNPEGSSGKKKKKKRKIPNPKLPIGTVVSIEPWNGIPAMGRRVRWHLTDVEGVYRYGGDGGRYDISHVEVNDKKTRVRKRHPLPESAEQCASRHGFGVTRRYSVLLRLRRHGVPKTVDGEVEFHHQGLLELPDFGAGIRVDCILYSDGAVSITERELLYGSKDSGWEARFGQPSYVPGTVMVLSTTRSSILEDQADLDTKSAFMSFYEELLGSSSFTVADLRNRADGSKLRVTSELKLLRGRHTTGQSVEPPLLQSVQAPLPPPISFDRDFKASSISLSRDGRTVTCASPDGRGTAYASVGFTKGVHYWEVKLEQADIGSVFIGVAEKPGSSFGHEGQPRLNRWHGWGFVNFRATYTAGAERVYGAHCHAGDTVGVLLDCDAGRVSFFFDGLKYGEHILNDLGCAFENVSPFGFNADGCGSGGAGQGAPSGIEGGRGGRYPAQGAVRPRALWPVIGLRNPGDRVTLSSKWMTSIGIDGPTVLKNVLAVDEILYRYDETRKNEANSETHASSVQAIGSTTEVETKDFLPKWFVQEAYAEYERWRAGRWFRSRTRGSGPYHLASFGLDVDLDTSPLACASACAALGLGYALFPEDRVVVKRSVGRMLELAEEAIVLGACQGRLFYRIVSQKSEGGSLTEGGGRAWFWDESEVVDDGLQLIGDGRGLGLKLPMLDRFKCTATGGLKIVYEGGAVVRSDLEIFDGSASIGSIPFETVIPQKDVLERRVNSCGVVRYRIKVETIGEGWISSRIRGGKEEPIVTPVHSDDSAANEQESERRFSTPRDSAIAWYEEYTSELNRQQARQGIVSTSANVHSGDTNTEWKIKDVEEFEKLLLLGTIAGLPVAESDALLASAVGAIADFSHGGDAVDCSFGDIVAALSFAVSSQHGDRLEEASMLAGTGVPGVNQAAAAVFSSLNVALPSTRALLARIAMLRAFNRRARYALPWLSVRPCQEGSAVFGGVCGHGASTERAGRSRDTSSMELWVQPPSIGTRTRNLRNLFFGSVKCLLLDSITEATTTPTPLSHDEYELPREIRTVRTNRLKARRAMAGKDNAAKRKHSVFSQLHNETRSWGGAALRRGFVAKGHGGQKRAFKVKLVGEGVNDYSGPYREAFTDAMREVTELDDAGHGALGWLEPSPNNLSGIGENRELFVFSTGERKLARSNGPSFHPCAEELRIKESFSSLTTERDESAREVEEALIFLGRMAGTACRHGIPVDLPLPLTTVWKALVEEKTDDIERLRELDLLAYRQLEESPEAEMPELLWWQQRMLNCFAEGMSNVLPVEIFPLFTGEELRDILCGNPDVDVDLLRRVVEYEGYEESDDVVQYFWEVLREMSSTERKKFLQFVWARSRLPMKESDFEAPFKIQKDTKNVGMDADVALPSASTCFFSLALPEYSSKEVLRQKLLFTIENVVTMESDYVTNDAEVGEGWRGL